MRIAIFGAAGGIGKFTVKHALEKGYEVNAFARDTSKLTISHDNLCIIKGEITDYESVKGAIDGCDAVIWCAGIPMKRYKNMDSLEGHRNLIKAMNELNIKRLIDWATTTVRFKKDKKTIMTVLPGFMVGIFLPIAKKELLAIAALITSSDLDWTIVRFLAPQNTPYTGKVKAGFGDVKMKITISREDIGAFMVEQIESKQYIRSMPLIGS